MSEPYFTDEMVENMHYTLNQGIMGDIGSLTEYAEAVLAGTTDQELPREIDRQVERLAKLAVEAASRAGDAALRCQALATSGFIHFWNGRGIPRDLMEEALALERSLPVGRGSALLGG